MRSRSTTNLGRAVDPLIVRFWALGLVWSAIGWKTGEFFCLFLALSGDHAVRHVAVRHVAVRHVAYTRGLP